MVDLWGRCRLQAELKVDQLALPKVALRAGPRADRRVYQRVVQLALPKVALRALPRALPRVGLKVRNSVV